MRKLMFLVAMASITAGVTLWIPRAPAEPAVDEAATNAQIDARLHVLLQRLVTETEARQAVKLARR